MRLLCCACFCGERSGHGADAGRAAIARGSHPGWEIWTANPRAIARDLHHRPQHGKPRRHGGDARAVAAHGRLLRTGQIKAKTKWNKRGYNFWHFTVDDVETVQHLPLDERGEHADHEGPGNSTSIGIEICEFREPARQRAAIERCAKLVAWLRSKYRISLDRVVPHYFWTMVHYNNWHKPCPRILLDGGRPGAKWSAFLALVRRS